MKTSATEPCEAMAAVRRRHDDGVGGVEICRALSALQDAKVRAAWRAAGADDDLAIFAVGGSGRQEVAPGSDLDLLFIAADKEAAAPAVKAVLRSLWDHGLQVGFSTDTPEGAAALAAADLHVATGLLTARLVCGDADLEAALRAALWVELSPKVPKLLDALAETTAARHARYGGSVYVLEPNLKQSPGGLRDLSVLLWAGALSYRVTGLDALLGLGAWSAQAAAEVKAARDHLLRVRNALHFNSGCSSDRLTFEHQEHVAARLGFGVGRRAVERFMACHYAYAAVVLKRARWMLARCQARANRVPGRLSTPQRVAIDQHFERFQGQLTVRESQTLARAPAQCMRMFAVAMAQGIQVHEHSQERAMELVPTFDQGWAETPVVVGSFLEVLTGPNDEHDALGTLHEVGLLGAAVPEFGAITHRTHHDAYHVHTVDVHTLRAVARLKALHRGALADAEPLLTQAMGQVEDALPLYLGLLLHDVGKALGGGHAAKGARLVPQVGRRLGLTPEQIRRATWLVRDHLLMAHTSQRRDLSDDQTIRQFARRVGSPEALAQLFILSWADASTTGPQAYNTWKAALLAELYARAVARLRAGLDLYDDPHHIMRSRRRAVTALLERGGDRLPDVNSVVDRFFDRLPTDYFQRTTARDITRHLKLVERLRGAPPMALDVVPRARRGYVNVHVAVRVGAGTLAAVTGALTLNELDVISATLHVMTRGDAIYVFRVRDTFGIPLTDAAPRWAKVRAVLARALSGVDDLDALLAVRHERAGGFVWPTGPAVEVHARCDAATNGGHTVLDVRGQDRPGLLYDVVKALDTAEIRIHLARIVTEAEAVHDTFFLKGRDGALDQRQAAAVVALAIEALAGPQVRT